MQAEFGIGYVLVAIVFGYIKILGEAKALNARRKHDTSIIASVVRVKGKKSLENIGINAGYVAHLIHLVKIRR
ncbi:MAG: hypothetical protein ACXIVD_12685 [Salinarimonas sp.]